MGVLPPHALANDIVWIAMDQRVVPVGNRKAPDLSPRASGGQSIRATQHHFFPAKDLVTFISRRW
jgi:hypothetical protein